MTIRILLVDDHTLFRSGAAQTGSGFVGLGHAGDERHRGLGSDVGCQSRVARGDADSQ